jgi:hypothetical protein
MSKWGAAWLSLLVCLMGCSNDSEPITPHELLVSHTWVSDSYIFDEKPTADFNWDCQFNQAIPEYDYEIGDFGRIKIEMELSFTPDSIYKRIIYISRYVKCKLCDDFEFVELTTDTLGAIFTAEDRKLWFGSRKDPFQYFFPILYNSRKEIVIQRFFEVSGVVGDSDCYFNDQPLGRNGQYQIDFVFSPK